MQEGEPDRGNLEHVSFKVYVSASIAKLVEIQMYNFWLPMPDRD
jgi:hypothetical protein